MKNYYLLTILVLLMACSEKLMEKPENLIERDKMVEVLHEVAILNAAKTTNSKVLQDNNIDPMPYIYDKYSIDSLQFTESDRYYASFPVAYEKMYLEVEANLENEREILENAKKVQDSLKVVEQEIERKKEREKMEKATDSLPEISPNKKQ